MSRSGKTVRLILFATTVVALFQLCILQSKAQVIDRASHAEHMLSLIHDNFIAESSDTFHLLSKAEGVYLVIWRLEMEVYNGGILQFLSNSSGSLTPHLPNALRAIGADDVVPIIDETLALVGRDIPWEDDARRHRAIQSLNDERRNRVWLMDKKLGECLKGMSISLLKYVLKHRDSFGMPDDFWREAASK